MPRARHDWEHRQGHERCRKCGVRRRLVAVASPYSRNDLVPGCVLRVEYYQRGRVSVLVPPAKRGTPPCLGRAK